MLLSDFESVGREIVTSILERLKDMAIEIKEIRYEQELLLSYYKELGEHNKNVVAFCDKIEKERKNINDIIFKYTVDTSGLDAKVESIFNNQRIIENTINRHLEPKRQTKKKRKIKNKTKRKSK